MPFKFKSIYLLIICLGLVACGGGGDSPSSGFTVDSGVAQKGPLAIGSNIFINELSTGTYQPNGKEYTFRTSNNFGNFTLAGITFGSSYLSTLAQGYYFNEISGLQSTDIVNLSGLSQIGSGADTVVNVNTLSSMAYHRTLSLATAKPTVTFAVARAQAQKELLKSFYIYNGTQILTGTKINNIQQPANLTAMDLSQNRAADQMLAAISGVVMTAGTTGGGVNALLSMASLDLADDGLLNNSPNYAQSVSTRLCAAAASTDFAAVAANLNSVYGTSYQASDLAQWVDTSGCVDQVINKYKFSSNNLVVNTLSKSPAYVAGPDDVGQCFSVGGVTTGASAGLYYKGGSTPIVGTQKVALGDSMSIGLTANTSGSFTGYIQRSAAAANGTCPSVVPGGGLTRVLKYTTVNGYTVGGTVSGLTGGQSVTLLNNGGNAVTVSANGAFAFSSTLPANGSYTVTVGTQPNNETCAVTNGTGTITSNSVSNVSVVCDSHYTPRTIINVDYINGTGFQTVYTNSLPTGSQDRTYVAWVKTTSSIETLVFSFGALNCLGNEAMRISQGKVRYFTNCADAYSSKSVNDGSWHLAVATYTSGVINTNTKLYIDGIADEVTFTSYATFI